MRSSENRTKVCGWMGYVAGDLRTSSGHGEVWIGVPVQCYMECNTLFFPFLYSRLTCFVTLLSQHNCITLTSYCVIYSLEKCIQGLCSSLVKQEDTVT